jgi:hypothetical protein
VVIHGFSQKLTVRSCSLFGEGWRRQESSGTEERTNSHKVTRQTQSSIYKRHNQTQRAFATAETAWVDDASDDSLAISRRVESPKATGEKHECNDSCREVAYIPFFTSVH